MTLLPLQQHPNFGRALRHIGVQVNSVTVSGAAPVQVIRRYGINYVARGPVWLSGHSTRPNDLRMAKLHLINSNGGDAQGLHAAGYRRIMTAAHVAELTVTADADGMAAHMQAKWRNVWRRSQNSPLRIRHAQFAPAKHQWLLQADLAQQKQKRFRALPHALIHAYPRHDVTVCTADMNGVIVAGMLFLRHGACATYHLGWTNDDGRAHAAHHRMLIDAAMHLAGVGVQRLDLGTVDTQSAPGLARFKIGSGAKIHPLGGSWIRFP